MLVKRIDYEFLLRPEALGPTCPRLVLVFLAVFLAASLALAHSSSDRLNLFPRLTAGQTLTYQISYRNEKQAKTKSSVVMASAPSDIAVNVRVSSASRFSGSKSKDRVRLFADAAGFKRSIPRHRGSCPAMRPRQQTRFSGKTPRESRSNLRFFRMVASTR
jgi:hypothetical protein